MVSAVAVPAMANATQGARPMVMRRNVMMCSHGSGRWAACVIAFAAPSCRRRAYQKMGADPNWYVGANFVRWWSPGSSRPPRLGGAQCAADRGVHHAPGLNNEPGRDLPKVNGNLVQ